MMDPRLFFLLCLKASLLSTGGTGNLPSLHADLLPAGWATDHDFAESLAIGQIAPGPSGYWVISLGQMVAGLPGALAAVVAICLPPLLVLAIERLYQRVRHHAAVEGFVRGLGLAVAGIFLVVLWHMMGSVGWSARGIAIMATATALAATRRVPVIVILAGAAVVGAVV